jgi:hypothetical protein
LRVRVDVHHDDNVVAVAQPTLGEQRHVVDDDGLRVVFAGTDGSLNHGGADQRMDDGVEPLARLAVGKHDGGHPFPVERPVARQDVVAERFDDLFQPRRPGSDHLTRNRIGIDNNRTECGQPTRDLALAGADPAGQADDEQQLLRV